MQQLDQNRRWLGWCSAMTWGREEKNNWYSEKWRDSLVSCPSLHSLQLPLQKQWQTISLPLQKSFNSVSVITFFDSYFSVFLCLFWVGSIFCPCLNASKSEFLNSHCAFLSLNLLFWRTHPYPPHPYLPWKESLLSELPPDMSICFLGISTEVSWWHLRLSMNTIELSISNFSIPQNHPNLPFSTKW